MADADWKKRLGITINYSSGDDDDEQSEQRVEFRAKLSAVNGNNGSASPAGVIDIRQPNSNRHLPAQLSADDLVNKYADYGSTPPRTRIKNKNKDWEQRKQKMEATSSVKMKINNASRMSRSRVNRRNTMDCALLNEMFVEDENKRTDKRGMTLQREADRDSKLLLLNLPPTIIERPQRTVCTSGGLVEERVESLPNNLRMNRMSTVNANNMVIESSNRYMCVQSRPVEQIGCRMSAPPVAFFKDFKPDSQLQTRKAFHETFANLIKLGSTDKQEMKISQEEHKYQTELKDLIWLELQAWHADRTLDQQDKFLYAARQNVGELLDEIMDYKFLPKYSRNVSVISDDSGIASDSASSTARVDTAANGDNEFRFPSNAFQFYSSHCPGCYSMYCKDCSEQQSQALKQVEILLTRLEAAESLFPSSCAMGQFFPLYKDPKFIGRVKAMCLWYNITRNHRLKLLILGRILARLQGKQVCWPVTLNQGVNSSSDNTDTDSGRDTADSKEAPKKTCTVQFDLEDDPEMSSNESTSSTDTTKNSLTDDPSVTGFGKMVNDVNLFNVHSALTGADNNQNSTNPYRKYMETVLKSRGLGKSLAFLHRLHNVVLRKARLTLEKPGSEEAEESEGDIFEDEDETVFEPPLDKEEEVELRRFGVWSPEYAELNLPSYVSAFIFLSMIPIEVIHEFLRMKIETKPIKPNPLSLEQLLKELREGIILAITHRERFNKHITTALIDHESELDKYLKILDEFNKTLKTVFDLYLDYVQQMILAATGEGQQKAALDKEWMFTKLVCPMIPGQHATAAKKFCSITQNLLNAMGERLVTRATELDEKILVTEPGANEKMEILAICRDTQSLFTEEREKSMKIMSFGKALMRDIEQADFHRDHSEEFLSKCKENDFVCNEVKEAVLQVKSDALVVRKKLTNVIERVQERCDIRNVNEMEEVDKQALLSRTREILHQGYKFGFEYHKDLMRLMETKMASCKDAKFEFNLSLGIVEFARMWMTFVMEMCERGRGLRPRWAAQGFDFLVIACDPVNSKHLTEPQFEQIKAMMDSCISHVIGLVSEPQRKRPSPRNRKASPATRDPTTPPIKNNLSLSTKSLFQQSSVREEILNSMLSTSNPPSPEIIRKQTSCDNTDIGITIRVPDLKNFTRPLREIRVRDSINRLDMELETKLRERNLIGQVKSLNSYDKIHIRARSVTFRWHRGIKIGQGRFGKVYTAVNNSTGELMAMKEISIQPGENRAIQMVAEELKIFEGITHKHLVKYFGVEIHREELLIFMELCSEGTLESLIELSGGLHEVYTRRFTVQLLSAVAELHKHGIVHRDIKAANIFLTNGGNCLKLGDFGCAVKIQSHQTMAGELQGLVGTQAYMAPEVFTRTNTEGHGRAADIWSVGCVVIEMSSGKRPWYQFDSNVQIMFKVGMGQRPEIPESLSQDGSDFLDKCLQHDPKLRWTAYDLLLHHFCKVIQDDSCLCEKEKEVRRSTRSKSKTFDKSPLKPK